MRLVASHGSHVIRPTRVEIDVTALLHNARVIRQLAGVPVVAVVKADAYGHGAPGVAAALDQAWTEPGAGPVGEAVVEAAGGPSKTGAPTARSRIVGGLAVSLVEEGVQLRDAGIGLPILVLGPALDGGHQELAARDLTAVVSDEGDLEALAEVGRQRGRPVAVHLKVDTGMHRLGIPEARVGDVIARAVAAGGVDVVGLMTHFANADVDDPGRPDCFTYEQLDRFRAAEAVARAAGAPLKVRHAANSSGTFVFPAARLDLVRVGIALYGNGRWAADDTLPVPRRGVMRLVTEVAQVRDVAAGGTVGYGGLWRAGRDTRVAVLPLGYADGLPRRATGQAAALIHGVRCPLVGAISMDIVIADVSALGDRVAPGDEAVLLGAQRGQEIRAAELAAWAGVSEYEVTCGMSKRVPRVYR